MEWFRKIYYWLCMCKDYEKEREKWINEHNDYGLDSDL
mgnify:FL=1